MLTENSRYRLADLIATEDEGIEIDLRPRLEYDPGEDDIAHVVTVGDTLHSLAATYFAGMPNPETLWWIIADYQPEPIIDPTISLTPGDIIVIPSRSAVQGALIGQLEDEAVMV